MSQHNISLSSISADKQFDTNIKVHNDICLGKEICFKTSNKKSIKEIVTMSPRLNKKNLSLQEPYKNVLKFKEIRREVS
jgi:hypothetical protein